MIKTYELFNVEKQWDFQYESAGMQVYEGVKANGFLI
jgi:hypothetical protein